MLGPLRPAEIESFLGALRDTPGAGLNDLDVVRRFLESEPRHVATTLALALVLAAALAQLAIP